MTDARAGSVVSIGGLAKAVVSLTDQAYAALEERIVTLELAPGAMLSEVALSELLNIGRTPVREALHRLAREGLVTILPRRGISVADFDIRRHLRMLEVRRELERLLAHKAAERATPGQRKQFLAIVEQMQATTETGDQLAFMRLDRAFNDLVSAAAENEFAASSMELMAGLSRRFWFMHSQRAPGLATIARRHIAIAEAIAAGDTDAAAAASDRLLDFVESITRNAVDW